MKYLKCKICGGEYNDISQDGVHYYHACPEITDKDGNTTKRKNARNENIKDKANWEGVEIIST